MVGQTVSLRPPTLGMTTGSGLRHSGLSHFYSSTLLSLFWVSLMVREEVEHVEETKGLLSVCLFVCLIKKHKRLIGFGSSFGFVHL